MSGSAFAVTHHAFSSGAGRTSDGNGSHVSTLKSPSYTKSVSWSHYQGGKQTVYELATEANIESGEQIVDGGSTEKTHINGGTQTVQNYGKAINTDIVSGLQQIMAVMLPTY
ncbi:hypothetical protein BHQ39_25320 [Shigella sp. FC3196]|nr:hypothetical protein BHQ36_25255 [Shigella sp. FC2531]OEG40183.1 hypothetical protein BHQ37_24920 [Shigella sp. FC2541]OEG50690.1 hypothetical protein BHQ39_25320 [Shigella sp. FC3196]